MRARLIESYALTQHDANLLTTSRATAQYFEGVVASLGAAHAKLAANWVIGDVAAQLHREERDIGAAPVGPQQLAALLERINDGTISGKIAKEVFQALWERASAAQDAVDRIIDEKGLRQISDSAALEGVIDALLVAHPRQLAEYRSGKDKLFGFFVGQAMKATQGKANPAQLNELLIKKLAG
jgi:aspartyl-tRNA(Asn)/glutamyl-tRNA(Gln) amidotransferase subunit B